MRLRAPEGHFFALSRVATVDTVTGQPQITRDDLKRMIPVTGRSTGCDLGSRRWLRDAAAIAIISGLVL